MRFVASKLRRTKTNRKRDADIDEQTNFFDPKTHAKINEKNNARKSFNIVKIRQKTRYDSIARNAFSQICCAKAVPSK